MSMSFDFAVIISPLNTFIFLLYDSMSSTEEGATVAAYETATNFGDLHSGTFGFEYLR